MRERRGPWYLITGLVLGAIGGLLFAWAVQPVRYTNTSPASLRAEFKDHYRALIASAFAANGDLVRAQARLDLLADTDTYQILAEQAQRALAEGKPIEEARALSLLAVSLGQPPATGVPTQPSGLATETQSTRSSPSLTASGTPPRTPNLTPTILTDALTPTPVLTRTVTLTATTSITPPTNSSSATPTRTPPATRKPTPTVTLAPTRTPTSTPGAPFALKKSEAICSQTIGEPQIRVLASDAAGEPVPGLEAIVTWDGGANTFFTGLKPEIGLGYADFIMTPGITYTLSLAQGGRPVTGLTSPECKKYDGSIYWGSWRLLFEQP